MYPPVHWALGGFFRGSKVDGCEASVSFPSSAFLTRTSTAVFLNNNNNNNNYYYYYYY